MKRLKDFSSNIKLFIVLIIILTIGIILRWGTIKKEIVRSFSFFNKTEQTDTSKNLK